MTVGAYLAAAFLAGAFFATGALAAPVVVLVTAAADLGADLVSAGRD
jgi:hypothetical protein